MTDPLITRLHDFMRDHPNMKYRLSELAAILGADLSERAVQQMIEDLRGFPTFAPICSRTGVPGYWWTTQAAELRDSAGVIRHHAKEMISTATNLEYAANRLDKRQMELL